MYIYIYLISNLAVHSICIASSHVSQEAPHQSKAHNLSANLSASNDLALHDDPNDLALHDDLLHLAHLLDGHLLPRFRRLSVNVRSEPRLRLGRTMTPHGALEEVRDPCRSAPFVCAHRMQLVATWQLLHLIALIDPVHADGADHLRLLSRSTVRPTIRMPQSGAEET